MHTNVRDSVNFVQIVVYLCYDTIYMTSTRKKFVTP